VEQTELTVTGARSVQMGQWQTNLSQSALTLSPEQVHTLETLLNDRYLPSVRRRFPEQHPEGNLMMHNFSAPAPVVRFDMAPLDSHDGSSHGVYEIEANTAGHSIAMQAGLPIHVYLSAALKKMGITRLGYAVTESRQDQDWDLRLLMDGLKAQGIDVQPVDLMNGVADFTPLWLRSGQEDLDPDGLVMPRFNQCLQWHIDGGGEKSYLFDIDPTAVRLSEVGNLAAYLEQHKAGVVLKEIGGWGTRNVEILARQQPHKKKSITQARLVKQIDRIFEYDDPSRYLLQAFVPPTAVDGGFMMWRVMGVYDAHSDRYRVVGGLWNWRRSLKLHGADDAVFGQIDIPSRLQF